MSAKHGCVVLVTGENDLCLSNGNMGSLSTNCSNLFVCFCYTKFFVSVYVTVSCFIELLCISQQMEHTRLSSPCRLGERSS